MLPQSSCHRLKISRGIPIRKFIKHVLTPTDTVTAAFFFLLLLINAVFASELRFWQEYVLINLLVIAVICAVSWWRYRKPDSATRTMTHYWLMAPVIFAAYSQMYYLIHPIRKQDYDALLIAVDRWMFGFDPTHALSALIHPVLTELTQIVYFLYYFFPMALLFEMLRRNRMSSAQFSLFAITFGFFAYYLSYFILPAVGPRHTLHSFTAIGNDLQGLFFTPYIRRLIDKGEFINIANDHLARITAHRNVFPSGHTLITVLVMYLSFRLKAYTRWIITVFGIILLFGTVYLRYHYVIDIIAGVAFMALFMWITGKLFNAIQRFKGEPEFDYSEANRNEI